jgi:hypothetical protein
LLPLDYLSLAVLILWSSFLVESRFTSNCCLQRAVFLEGTMIIIFLADFRDICVATLVGLSSLAGVRKSTLIGLLKITFSLS